MKKVISILSAIFIFILASVLLTACSGESTLPDGTYTLESTSGSPFNPMESMPLGPTFEVSGNTITAYYSDSMVLNLEYSIMNKEITLIDDGGSESVVHFEKKSNNSYLIGKATYTRE